MLGTLPLNALRAFEVASRHLSFSKAAAELNVTPAAISQQIRALEEFVGTPLFYRRARGLALTPAAEAGLPMLRDAFDRLHASVQHIRGETQRSTLKVWTAPSFAAKWLVPRLQQFSREHADVNLGITATSELMDSTDIRVSEPATVLRENDLDIAIRFGKGQYPGCRVDKLMSADVVPLCSPALLRNSLHRLTRPDELRHFTLLHDDTPYEGRPDWLGWLAAAGVHDIDTSRGVHFNHVSLALEAAIEGQGVVLSIAQLASRDLAEGRLIIPFEYSVPLSYAYYLISLEDASNTDNINAFREWLLSEIDTENQLKRLSDDSRPVPEAHSA